MNESATDVIAARTRREEPMGSMVAGSVAAHAIVIVAVMVLPVLGTHEEPERELMMISLTGGAEGPITSGMTQMGGRQVEEVAPPPPVPRPEPPAEAPKMTLPPEKPEKPAPKPKPEPRKPPAAAERPPATGEQVTEGNTPVETPARGVGFGLSSGGGGGTASVQLDSDFCCNEYLRRMQQSITERWDRNQGLRGTTVMKFTIQRDGGIEDVEVERSSGSQVLDLAARRALALTTLPPLPPQYTNQTLIVHITFSFSH